MVQAHKLQLDLGQYCESILGLGLIYMQPTMNPCGYLVVKQAENLRYSTCMENKERKIKVEGTFGVALFRARTHIC